MHKALNPNHNAFILVNDGTLDRYGGEIDYRCAIETGIGEQLRIPVLLIAMGGGKSALEKILHAVQTETPVILVAVSCSFKNVINYYHYKLF